MTLSGGGASRILHITGDDTDAVLRDLTLTGGRTTGDNEGGGAIRADDGAALTLVQVTVTGNSTAGDFSPGGGICSSGVLTLTGSTVSGNSTTGNYAFGGGIFGYNVTLTNSTLSDNSTEGGRLAAAGCAASRRR